MRIERINENKIKVMFDSTELEENNISIHSFLSNSIEAQKLFLAILDIANEEFGFNTSNCKISSETISFSNKHFVIFVTKSQRYINTYPSSPYNLLDITNSQCISTDIKTCKHSFRDIEYNTNELIYKFSDIEDFFSFSNYCKNTFNNISFKNSLYQFNNDFYIKINLEKFTIISKFNIISMLSEYSSYLPLSPLTVLELEEHSNLIIKDNAIQKIF